MFSGDVRLFSLKPTDNSKTTAESHSKRQQCFFLQAGPGCIHGEAACSYNITAHLIVED